MRYQTPIDIATERAAKKFSDEVSKGVRSGTAARLRMATQAAEMKKLAQGIDASELSCFIREDGAYRPLPSDHLLFVQVSAFLDNRGQPVCKVVKTLDLRAYRQRAMGETETFRIWNQEFSAPAPPAERIRCDGIMLEWQKDIYLEADDNGDPVRRAVPSVDPGDHKAESQSVVALRVGFIEKLAAAFGVDGEVADKVKEDLRNICCNHLTKEPFVFTPRTFDKAWSQAKNIRCHNPAGPRSPEK